MRTFGRAARRGQVLSSPHRFLRDRRGSAAVEFAFAASILALATLVIVDFSMAMWTGTTLKQVANDATRYAAIRGAEKASPATESEVISYARDQLVSLNTDAVLIDVVWSPNNTAGSTVTVTLGYDYEFFAIGFIPLAPIRIEQSSTMTVG